MYIYAGPEERRRAKPGGMDSQSRRHLRLGKPLLLTEIAAMFLKSEVFNLDVIEVWEMGEKVKVEGGRCCDVCRRSTMGIG